MVYLFLTLSGLSGEDIELFAIAKTFKAFLEPCNIQAYLISSSLYKGE
jgi:hypothetical protein